MVQYDAHSWLEHLLDIKGSMVREIVWRVMSCVAWSAGVVAFDRYVHPLRVPTTMHSLVGVALGLLLVFRTNASYDRFWEGRKMWGGIVNETRNLARNSAVLLRDDPGLHAEVVRWTVAFAYTAMHSLRGSAGVGPVSATLPKREVDAVLAAQHPPLAVAVRVTDRLAHARERGLLSDYARAMLDQNVQLLVDYLGACERIRRTPLPFAYVVHLRRALILYFFTLPFALVAEFGWVTVVAIWMVTYVFFGIEEIGVEIEDPFGQDDNDLPLETICETIAKNLLALEHVASTPLVTPPRSNPARDTNRGA
jgi:putative membrane protein